jgi:hypothetical protein
VEVVISFLYDASISSKKWKERDLGAKLIYRFASFAFLFSNNPAVTIIFFT